MPALFDKLYRWGKTTPIVAIEFDKRFRSIDERLLPLEDRRFSENLVLDAVQERVLSRTEAVIAGLRDRLVSITQLEWLTGNSPTPLTLVQGADASFLIEQADRVLFAPGPYAVVSSAADPTGYAIVRSLGYNRTSGQFDCHVETLMGLAGQRTDWSIQAVAGSALAQRSLFEQAKDVAAQVLANLALGKAWATQAAGEVVAGQGFSAKRYAADAEGARIAAGLNAASAAGNAALVTTKTAEAVAAADRAATFDPTNYPTKAVVNGQIASLKGDADAAHDSLGELAALIEGARTAISGQATAIAANTKSIADNGADGAVTFVKLAGAAITSAAADLWTNVASKLLTVRALWLAQAFTVTPYAATVTLDGATFFNTTITMTGNLTLANPVNMKPGQSGLIRLVHSGAARTVAVGSAWKLAGGTPTASTTAGVTDAISYIVVADGGSLRIEGSYLKGIPA